MPAQRVKLSTDRQVSSIPKVRMHAPCPLRTSFACVSHPTGPSMPNKARSFLRHVSHTRVVLPPTPTQSDFTPKHQPQGAEKWVYPSEQQYFNAMKVRKTLRASKCVCV